MHTSTIQNPTTQTIVNDSKKERFIFVIRLHSGKIAVGSATNPAKRIAAINSGYHPKIKHALQVNEIIGIKSIEEGRTMPGVFHKFEQKYGKGNVIDL